MVLRKTIEVLKERSHEEKRTVPSVVALSVVGVLVVGWSFMFFRGAASVITKDAPQEAPAGTSQAAGAAVSFQ